VTEGGTHGGRVHVPHGFLITAMLYSRRNEAPHARASATDGAEDPIISIAGSEHQADFVHRFTAELNALGAPAGRPARSVTVWVAGSSDDAPIAEQIARIHNIQRGIGLPLSRVFDLWAR
jgi:hypothetical protein